MFSTLYFSAASVLASPALSNAYASKVLAGHFHDAVHMAAARTERDDPQASPTYEELQAYADIQLVLGRYEEAEDTFRLAQKALRHSREAMRVASCRNAGWQAFFQNHLSTALTCFKRVTEEAEVTPGQKIECLVGWVLVLHHLGRLDAMCARFEELGALAQQLGDARWLSLVEALRRDMLVQYHVRFSDQLADHIYWRSVALEFVPTALGNIDTPYPEAQLAAIPVLAKRHSYLEHLQALADGRQATLEPVESYLRWSLSHGLDEYQRSLRLEVALACLVAKRPNISETMLTPCNGAPAPTSQHARWYLDYLYCLAKVRQQQGRIQEFSQLYARYALLSIRHVRADSVSIPVVAAEATQTGRSPARTDDISVRLPGRYRRAYGYLMENLERADLSVGEIAAHIGVTERALQAAFKTHLALSPSQLIRRQRMERIRGDLIDNNTNAQTVLEVAHKWGVQHRSTLVNGYRKLFNEVPSATFSR